MKADAASDVMNVCVDGWVEVENKDLTTGTGQLVISEPERSFHPKIFHSASYFRFKQIAGPKNIQHNEIQGKMTLKMVTFLVNEGDSKHEDDLNE